MKKKMSNRRFMSIWIPIVSVMVVLAIGANIAGSVFGGILDTSLGRGERHVLHLENVATGIRSTILSSTPHSPKRGRPLNARCMRL